jgi:hypothetical protein
MVKQYLKQINSSEDIVEDLDPSAVGQAVESVDKVMGDHEGLRWIDIER